VFRENVRVFFRKHFSPGIFFKAKKREKYIREIFTEDTQNEIFSFQPYIGGGWLRPA
jgi:hypothetical protein